MPTPPFVPALDLSRDFYREVVARLLRDHRHSAALFGTGSEVLGYDTDRSTDHDWGPRLQIFVEPDAVETARAALAGRLPDRFRDRPTRIGSDERAPAHRVDVQPLGSWLVGQLGVDPRGGLDNLDWLAIPQQQLLGVTRGAVYADPDRELQSVRDRLAWYPHDVWLWLLACQWTRIFQEIAFVGRAAEVGDDLGSKIIAARLAREVMRLRLLQHRNYWPYTKWFGSAFAGLPDSDGLAAALGQAVDAVDYPTREAGLVRAYKIIATAHDDLGITDRIDWSIGCYFTRPYAVLHGEFATACRAAIADDQLRRLPLVGSVDQFVDSTDVLSSAARSRLLRDYWDRLGRSE
ncbi:hypothetical protein GCM10011575_09280 [Microlunatus endophyticus]|uniref:DUF4037 domain-containing protein n=1 Tax=Microlunatus endophyticus TaxID=1716077 RepID=A0A917S4P3_9ACTN|nr:DUF4037 domain-containing protein [Microlunatus endophyticus]GGL53065.1 hypothetical protein GCM10011575_09280 [Microlunatus endophyticus]